MTDFRRLSAYEFTDASDLGRQLGGRCFSDEGLPISLTRFEVGSHESFASSSDKHLLCLAKRSDGWLDVDIGGERASYAPFDHMMIFAPCSADQWYDFKGRTENYLVSIEDGFLGRLAEHWKADTKVGKLDPRLQFSNSRVSHLVGELYRLMSSQVPGWRILVEANAMQISAELFSHFVGDRAPKSKARLDDLDMTALTDFMDAYIDWDVGLTDMAGVVDMDVYSFSRAFKVRTGASPVQFFIQRRIELACRLLADRDLSLAEVAYSCGFSSQSHLTTTFKKHMGVTPGAYRRQC